MWAEEALRRLREVMGKLKLTVNEEKTRSAQCRKGSSTSWDTRSGGWPARPAWASGRSQKVASSRMPDSRGCPRPRCCCPAACRGALPPQWRRLNFATGAADRKSVVSG